MVTETANVILPITSRKEEVLAYLREARGLIVRAVPKGFRHRTDEEIGSVIRLVARFGPEATLELHEVQL